MIPLPREHGAWMMLYAPLLTGLWIHAPSPPAAAALVALATAVFFGQNAAGLLLRGRGAAATWRWLIISVAVGLAALAALVIGWGHTSLLLLAVPAASLFAWQAWRRRSTRRQVDRTLANELATTAVLSLGAMAAAAVGHGQLGWQAALTWAGFTAYFAGTVLYVKMRVDAARRRELPTAAWRWRTGRACGVYHLIAGLAITGLLAWTTSAVAAAWIALAWAPAALRAGIAWARLAGGAPPLQRIGLAELAWATWFSAGTGLALTGT